MKLTSGLLPNECRTRVHSRLTKYWRNTQLDPQVPSLLFRKLKIDLTYVTYNIVQLYWRPNCTQKISVKVLSIPLVLENPVQRARTLAEHYETGTTGNTREF